MVEEILYGTLILVDEKKKDKDEESEYITY